jgi:hypothetical protein
MAGSVAHQTGAAQATDLAGVFERVRSAEETILTRLAMLDDRLSAIEKQLSASPTETNVE